MIRKIWEAITLGFGLWVIISAVDEINNSTSWLEMFRGLFWLAVGGFCLMSSVDYFKKLRSK